MTYPSLFRACDTTFAISQDVHFSTLAGYSRRVLRRSRPARRQGRQTLRRDASAWPLPQKRV